MQLGEVIRKYRKEKNLTQEEMAKRLGVTAPAVNKWENGNSLPDITLLAPIARLLGVSLDTLLSFQEELTEEEINHYIHELDDRLKNKSYEEAFQWAKGVIETWPDCELLILHMAVLLNARLLVDDVPDMEEYEAFIKKYFERALESRDENIRYRAACTLCGFHTRKKQYDQAEKYLEYLSEKDPERKRRQAEIYGLTGRKDEAYKAYEEMLFAGCNMLSLVFNGLYQLAMQENDRQKAHLMVEKQRDMSRLFEMGKYQEFSWGLELATLEKDADAVITLAKGLMSNVAEIGAFRKSPLFEHMHFHEVNPEFLEGLKKQMLDGFRDEETFGWLMEDERWKELVG